MLLTQAKLEEENRNPKGVKKGNLTVIIFRGKIQLFISTTNFLFPPACRVVGGQSRKMAKPIFGRGVGGAV